MKTSFATAGQSAVLDTPSAAVTFAAATLTPLLGWRSTDGVAHKMQLALSVNAVSLNPDPIQSSLPAATGSGVEAWQSGYFKIQYGAGALTRERWVDLAPGLLYLGACDQITVSAARWRGTAFPDYSSDFVPLQVGAACAEAQGGAYSEFTSTNQFYVAAAGVADFSIDPPAGAYASAVGAAYYDAAGGGAYWGSAEPNIYFNSRSEGFVISPSQYLVAPPFRRSMGACRYQIGSTAVIQEHIITVKWFLEP